MQVDRCKSAERQCSLVQGMNALPALNALALLIPRSQPSGQQSAKVSVVACISTPTALYAFNARHIFNALPALDALYAL